MNIEKEKIVVLGASGHARVVIDIVEKQARYSIAGVLDPTHSPGDHFFGYLVLGKDDDWPRLATELQLYGGVIATGDNALRHRIVQHMDACHPGFRLVCAVHPGAQIARDVSIGEGTVIMAGAVVNPGCTIGRCCILNTHSSLDHDSVMGDFSSLGPHAATGGGVRIGPFAALGLGANVIHNLTIGEHTVIGAGATVLDDMEPFKVAVGTPCLPIRDRKAGDRYL